jgi:hypothetical protein
MPCSTSQALRTLVVQPLTGGGIARQVETLLASLRSYTLCSVDARALQAASRVEQLADARCGMPVVDMI